MAAKSALGILPALALGTGMLLSSYPANAIPQCVNTAANTTLCQTDGNTQIATHPGAWTYNYGWPGFGWVGFGWPAFVIGIG